MKKCFLAIFLFPVVLGAERTPLNGVFVPEVDLTMKWMEEANHPAIKGENGVQRYRDAAYSGDPIQHLWDNGQLTVKIEEDWKVPLEETLQRVDEKTWRFIQPADESNTEIVHDIRILNDSLYFIEITVNDRVTREYFHRHPQSEPDGRINSESLRSSP